MQKFRSEVWFDGVSRLILHCGVAAFPGAPKQKLYMCSSLHSYVVTDM